MAEALWLVVKASPEAPANTVIDGIHAVLINKDDGQTEAQVIAAAEAKLVAAHHPVKSGYFTNAYLAATLIGGGGTLNDNQDTYVILDRGVEVIQG